MTRFVPHDAELDLTAVECDYVALAAATAVRTAGIRAELTRRRRKRVQAEELWLLDRPARHARYFAIMAGAR